MQNCAGDCIAVLDVQKQGKVCVGRGTGQAWQDGVDE